MPELDNGAAAGLSDPSEAQQLAAVLWSVDEDLGLGFWPMPLSVARFWTQDPTPAPLDLTNPLLIRPVLERLQARFPTPPDAGWFARTCDAHTSRWTSWLVEIPSGIAHGLKAQGTVALLDRLREALLPATDPTLSWTFPPVLHYPAEQRPTGRMVATMDDTLLEATLDLAVTALNAHAQRCAERRAMLRAIDADRTATVPAASRARARL